MIELVLPSRSIQAKVLNIKILRDHVLQSRPVSNETLLMRASARIFFTEEHPHEERHNTIPKGSGSFDDRGELDSVSKPWPNNAAG